MGTCAAPGGFPGRLASRDGAPAPGGVSLPVPGESGGPAPFALVVVPLPGPAGNRVFHYRIPPQLGRVVQPGSRVRVPFGAAERVGMVVGVAGRSPVAETRELLEVVDPAPLVPPALLLLARWVSRRYGASLADTLRAVLPPGLPFDWRGRPATERRVRYVCLAGGVDLEESRRRLARSPAQRRLLEVLAAHPAGLLQRELLQAARTRPAALQALVARGLARVEEGLPPVPQGLPGAPRGPGARSPVWPLSPDQERAVQEIGAAVESGRFRAFLLHGVTGSGKTEVYLRAIDHALRRGRTALCLVPEIALTTDLASLYRARFGEQVAVLHSRLPEGERAGAVERARQGTVRVVVGPRSAVFAPLPDPGVIVVDEEHVTSYKQEESPRYHAREVALERGRLSGAPVVLGSATPSLETYALALEGRLRLLTLPARVDQRPLPRVEVVDMRAERRRGNPGILSRRLAAALAERLARGEQSILLLNRRGWSRFALCRACGTLITCGRCEVAMTVHGGGQSLLCHYCNEERPLPPACPACGSPEVRQRGAGTERLEEVLRRRFPRARVARMDLDTTSRRGSFERILAGVHEGRIDVLVGTQMVAKGFDFPRVTLVGVVDADVALAIPDFRAGERAFQLLTQVAGRAGRGELPGEVIFQTFNPESAVVRAAAAQDYAGFYRAEVAFRRRFGYPPFVRLARFLVSGPDDGAVRRAAEGLARHLREAAGSAARTGAITLLGPAPAPLPRLNRRFRWHLLAKGPRLADLLPLAAAAGAFRPRPAGVRIAVDVDPLDML